VSAELVCLFSYSLAYMSAETCEFPFAAVNHVGFELVSLQIQEPIMEMKDAESQRLRRLKVIVQDTAWF
jgi:hypothetical protein